MAEVVLGALAVVALALLAVRSYTRLELRWDAWWYHVPFAAKAVHMDIDYSLPPRLHSLYEGHPFLPHLLMGMLWRLTGRINAIGVINIAAFIGFLAVCHRKLKAPFFVVAPIALTTPAVIIHSATSYVDLFSNAFLATGFCVLGYVYLYDKRADRMLLIIGLGGVIGAMSSKPQLVTVGAMALVLYALVYRPRVEHAVLVAVVAFSNNIKNLLLYRNPVWPVEVPVLGKMFPATYHYADPVLREQRPPGLLGHSQVEVFFRSLFETDNPTHYPNRLRWTLDQGNTAEALRMGGFWNVNVAVYLAIAIALLVLVRNRRGRVVVWSFLGVILLLSLQPNSHDLRYYQFIPLCWAGIIGVLYREFRRRDPAGALALLGVVGVLFLVMAQANRPYYEVKSVSYRIAARAWSADVLWSQLRPGYTYCLVGEEPKGIFYTGPTMREFSVVDRPELGDCPPGLVPIIQDVIHYERRT